MDSTSTYVYRLIKSSWGILISITATARVGETGVGKLVLAEFPVRVAFSAHAEGLADDMKQELTKGLARAAPRIVRVTGVHPILVDVNDVSYVESDFQVEGLSVAMLRWAETEFGLDNQEIVASFDRESNRYNFHWS